MKPVTHLARRRRRQSRDGAAMIVVMLILLTITSLAVFAVQSTSYELRAAGHSRTAMQADYVSEAGLTCTLALVDELGPQAILHSIAQNHAAAYTTTMAPFEPELAAGKEGYRFHSADQAALTASGLAPVEVGAIGTSQPYTPTYTVDVNDHFVTSRPIPGQRSDGLARLHFLHATYTARGRMRLASDYTGTTVDPRQYHETASTARAYGISGPFAQ